MRFQIGHLGSAAANFPEFDALALGGDQNTAGPSTKGPWIRDV